MTPKEKKVLAAFVKVARYARNFPHPKVPIERLRSLATMAEMLAEQTIGKKEYDAICAKAFDE